MPIHHFHLCDGSRLFDPRGVDLPDAKAAAQHGAQLAKRFGNTARALSGSEHRSNWHVHVTDEDGHTLGRFGVPER
jgi:hypothetical protein